MKGFCMFLYGLYLTVKRRICTVVSTVFKKIREVESN
jgi:hypothetical protein